jgi:hypothetical protein
LLDVAKDAILPSFLIQQVVSTAGAIVIGDLAAIVPAVVAAAVTKNTSGGNWADLIADQNILRATAQ